MRETIELANIYKELLPRAKRDGNKFYYGAALIGEIVTEPLQMVTGNDYYCEALKYYVPGFNSDTEYVLHADDVDLPVGFNFNSINLITNCVHFQVEPIYQPPTSITFLKYCGPDITQVLLSDGSVTMEEGYLPTKGTSIVTKSYADQVVDVATSITYGIKNSKVASITQNNKPLPVGVWYQTNATEEVILTSDLAAQKSYGTFEVTSSPIVVQSVEDFVSVCVQYVKNGVTYTTELAKTQFGEIIDGHSNKWSIVSVEKPYTSADFLNDKYKWAYSYRCTLNSELLESVRSSEIVNISFKSNVGQSAAKRVGVDAYMSKAYVSSTDYEFTYSQDSILKALTKVISGNKYVGDGVDTIDIETALTIDARLMPAFYNEAMVHITANDAALMPLTKTLKGVRYNASFTYQDTLSPKVADTIKVEYKVLNLIGQAIIDNVVEIPIPIDLVSNEAQRIAGPSAETLFPEANEFTPWTDEYQLKEFDMVQKQGVYTCSDTNSILTIKLEPKEGEHYSHVYLDAIWDGRLYIMSEGYTNWLNANGRYPGIGKPLENDDKCRAGDTVFTFGKVVYDTPVYLRFIKCSKVEIKKMELN